MTQREQFIIDNNCSESYFSDPTLTKYDWLKGKKATIYGGCELSYFRDYLLSCEMDVEHTFELGTSMDPFDELSNPGSELIDKEADYIIFSQIQKLKSILLSINYDREIDLFEELNNILNQLKFSIKTVRNKNNKPIFLFTYPILDLNINGVLAYTYKETSDSFLRRYTTALYEIVKEHKNVFILDAEKSFNNVVKTFDNIRPEMEGGHPEKVGGILIGEYFFKHLAVLEPKLKKIKCIVLDLDNTMWKGVLREDGVTGIEVYKDRIEALFHLSQKGIVLALCSKNDPEDTELVKSIFEKTPGFLRNIVSFQINWQPKSQNIKSLAKTLNIGLDTFAFFDDNPFERDEVKTNIPEINVFKDTEIIEALNWVGFQSASKVTETAKNRIQFYKTEVLRKKEEQSTIENSDTSLEDYLMSTGLNLKINKIFESDINRIIELLQRTNQQNATMKRTDLSTLTDYYNNDQYEILALSLTDKFGEYGIIGTSILKKENETVELQEFALSCRAMGKKVEHTLLLYLLNQSISLGAKNTQITVTKTSRNGQFLKILNELGFQESKKIDEQTSILSFEFEDSTQQFEYPRWFQIEAEAL